MGFAALITWFAAVLAGLYMFTVWLIENDVTSRHTAPSKLPVPVVFTHLTLAVTGLGVWVAYLVLDREMLAWTAFGLLSLIVLLGLSMFARWIPVYRDPGTAGGPGLAPAPQDAATVGHPGQYTVFGDAGTAGRPGQYAAFGDTGTAGRPGQYAAFGDTGMAGRPAQIPVETNPVPAEGNFPVAVVAVHGLLAGSTLVLVFLTALGIGGS